MIHDNDINTGIQTQEVTPASVTRTSMNLPDELWKEIQKLAIDRDTTATALVIEGMKLVLAGAAVPRA